MNKWWFSLGVLAENLRFQTFIEKNASSPSSFRVRKRVKLSKAKEGTLLNDILSHALREIGIDSKEYYNTNDEIEKWFLFIERLDADFDFLSLIHDKDGFHTMQWVLDNPPPSNFDGFVSWAKNYDNLPMMDLQETPS